MVYGWLQGLGFGVHQVCLLGILVLPQALQQADDRGHGEG